MIKTIEGKKKKIRLNRIHLEEDAGKSLHELDENFSALDFNRAGVPLIEIVSEPDIRSGEEAYEYLNELRRLVRYLGICDGNMEEGSMRCDANISVRKKGDPKLGSRVEVKNLNSMRNVKKAIEYEGARLIGLLENNEKVKQQTRSFDATTGTTFAIREKEEAEDYRYFPEPDLTAFDLGDEFIDNIRRSIPVLREQRIAIYKEKFSLSDYDSATLTDEKEFSDYFEELVKHVSNYKAAANWMLGPVRSWLNEKGITIEGFPLGVRKLATLVNMVEDGRLSFSTASSRLFHSLLQDPAMEPEVIAEKLNLLQVKESDFLEPMVLEVLEQYKEKVKEYKKGKKGLLALFVGEVMKRSKGKADPVRVNEIMIEKLKTF